jgi:membrane fusion protein (multidrug efflux system)
LRVLVQILIALVMLAAAGAAYWHFYGLPWLPQDAQAQGGPVAPGRGGPPGGFAIPVETFTVVPGTIERRLTAVGSLRSGESVVIRPEVSGRVVEIGFAEGEPVQKGQVLVALDRSVNEAEVASEQAMLDLRRASFERQAELVRRGSGTKAAYDQAEAEMRQAEAAVALARARMSKLTIAAPFTGVVGLRNVSIGDFVELGDAIVNLEQIDPLKVDFRVAENFLAAVRVGQPIEITVDAFGKERFEGEVYAIDPLIDAAGRSIQLRASLANPDGRLRPGLFARVELVLAERTDALLVPEAALVPQGTAQLVFKVVDGKAVSTPVRPGIRREGMVEVVEGLAAGDVVVTAGQIKLRDGAPVQPVVAAPTS